MNLLKKCKYIAAVLICTGAAAVCAAADMSVTPADIRLEADYEGRGNGFDGVMGYHLYIRKKDGVSSVLLTETTRDPTGMLPNYAFRTHEWNPINGDEIRLLNGRELQYADSKYSIIDSTVEYDSQLGEAFHLYIPTEMQYGYPDQRHGIVHIQKGTFINIRTFEKPYADYSGAFQDNPYVFDLIENPAPDTGKPPQDAYNEKAARSFDDIANTAGGRLTYSKGPETIVEDIMHSIRSVNPKQKADMVFAIDATGSMKDDIARLRSEWIPKLRSELGNFGSFRLGLLLYRDYGDDFKYRRLPVKYYPFTDNIDEFVDNLNEVNIRGNEGGDIPEAVYEALYASLDFYDWRDDASRKIILIGDAEPHAAPRGNKKYTRQLITMTADVKEITIDAIITPDKKTEESELTLTK